jgi:hypothetical protein
LGFAQETFVAVYDALPSPDTQHMVIARKLTGELDVALLQRTLALVAERHAVLRVRHGTSGGQHCMFVEPRAAIPLELRDLRDLSPDHADKAAREIIEQQRRARFALDTAPLLRTCLIRLDAETHIFVLVIHHSICDGWSLSILIQDTVTVYSSLANRRPPRLPAMPIQFPDYAAWLRESVASIAGRSAMSYWSDRLGGARSPFALPRDEQSGADHAYVPKYAGGLSLSNQAAAALRRLARAEKTTPIVVLLAAFGVVLSRWSGSGDVLIAVTHSGRQRPETWPLIGCLMQGWVLRIDLEPPRDFIDVVRQVRNANNEAQEHLIVPFLHTKQLLAAGADERPLLHITFNYLPLRESDSDASWSEDLEMSVFPMPSFPAVLAEGRGEKLVLNFVEQGDSIKGILRYLPTHFSGRTVDRFWEQYCALLETAFGIESGSFATVP